MIEEIEERPMTVEEYLNSVSYALDPNYIPSDFALEFVNFIKLVDGGRTENKTPVVHYKMIDNFIQLNGLDTINMCHRGIAKSTLKEYLILYLGVYGELPVFGKVPYAIYVSDSIDNGVKKMRKSLEFRWKNSDFLQQYIPEVKITDIRWEFINVEGNSFVVSGYGAKTGVRGTRENGSRPVLALLDDLISDSDARSPTIIADVEDTVNKAIEHALHPTRRKVIWSGTPFNANDPLYKAVESGAWNVNVYPVCEEFPCSREEFRGSWPDRFTYDAVKSSYTKAKKTGKLDAFYQELMLRIMSDEEKVVQDGEIGWYSRKTLLENKQNFNFYITTDFATSDRNTADNSVIFVWALSSDGTWYWVDGICRQQLMDANVSDLFKFVQKYRPLEVGIEVSGQQGGFIPWLTDMMIQKNTFFALASHNNKGAPGLRPVTNKLERFLVTQPLFRLGKIKFPREMEDSPIVKQILGEISLVTKKAIKSKTDDCLDGISQIPLLNSYKPSTPDYEELGGESVYGSESNKEGTTGMDSYIV